MIEKEVVKCRFYKVCKGYVPEGKEREYNGMCIGCKREADGIKHPAVNKKAAPKKATNMPHNGSLLSDAIKDIDAEISNLNKEKAALRGSISSLSSSLSNSRKMEEEMQEKIANLVQKEARLIQKKKNLESKLDTISDKANKMTCIKSEMTSI